MITLLNPVKVIFSNLSSSTIENSNELFSLALILMVSILVFVKLKLPETPVIVKRLNVVSSFESLPDIIQLLNNGQPDTSIPF